jgi:hypothetical protein
LIHEFNNKSGGPEMKRNVMIILVGKRKEAAVNVQKLLTTWGCIIKTRLGLHDGVLDNCSNSGLLVLELVGEKEKRDELAHKISLLTGVKIQLVELELDEE